MKFNDLSLDQPPESGLEPFVDEFFKDRLEDLNQLQSLFRQSDYIEMRKIAHKLIGICAPYGFQTLGYISSQLSIELKENASNTVELLNDMSHYLKMKSTNLGL